VDITERSETGATVLEVKGRMTMQTSHQLLDELKGATSRSSAILVDLSGVDYMDSSGVGVLVTALKLSKSNGIRFVLSGIKDRVRVVMEMSGLTTLFEIFEDQDAALRALQS